MESSSQSAQYRRDASYKRGDSPRALIATNHLMEIKGSEVVALETTQYIASLGYETTVFTNWAAAPMGALVSAIPGVQMVTDPASIRPFTYDAVYAQHQVLGLFDYAQHPDDLEFTKIVMGRLSRRSFMESGGWLHDRLLVDHFLANSELTLEHLRDIGYLGPITNFRNAAPRSFSRAFEPRPPVPRRITVVTNHREPALLEAIELLRQRTRVDHVGISGAKAELVTPESLTGTDLIISIGKTVPYALVGRIPVYVYDHFGGPGYLNASNFERAGRYNFTGRCCSRKLTAVELAAEIMDRYAEGVAFACDITDEVIEQFSLPRYLDQIFKPCERSNSVKRKTILESPFLQQERMLASHVRNAYVRERRLEDRLKLVTRRLRETEQKLVNS